MPKRTLAIIAGLLISGCSPEQRPAKTPSNSQVESPGAGTGKHLKANPQSSVQPAADTDHPDDPVGPIHFTSMIESSRIEFRHTSGNSAEKPFPATNGSGVATLDYDLDGCFDLYFANGTTFPIDIEKSQSSDAFYRNSGDWEFQDVTDDCGFGYSGYSTGLAVGDYNNDGFPDLYVAAVGANKFYFNLGDGTFAEVAAATRTDDASWTTSAAFVDFDNDGELDLYVCNYAQWTWEHNRFCGDQNRGIRMYCSPTLYPAENDVLYRNAGSGFFDNVSETEEINSPPGRAQGVICADLNADSRIDIYISNDINPNTLLVEQGPVLVNIAENSGIAYDHLGRAQASMGIAVGDVDRNGLPDVFITNYEKELNALYENRGSGQFIESGSIRMPSGSLPSVGWGTALSDFDLDGWLDLVVTNGHTDDNLQELGKEGVYLQPPGLWRNVNGVFTVVGGQGGEYFQRNHCGRGLLTSDLDNDGDSDVVIGHQDDRPALLRNDCAESTLKNSLRLQLIGRTDNRDAIGAFVEISSTGKPLVHAVFSGGSYESSPDRRIIFASPEGSDELVASIRWPNGSRTEVGMLKTGNSYAIIQPKSADQIPMVITLTDHGIP